jgi:hypothetical protein
MGLLLLGGQLMSVGFLAELFVAYQGPKNRGYSIAQRTPVVPSDGRPHPSEPTGIP